MTVSWPRSSKKFCVPFAISVLGLAACTSPDSPILVQPQLNEIVVPSDQQSCPDIPLPPDPDDPNTTQAVFGLYMADLIEVVQHCKLDLDTLNLLIREYNESVRAFNSQSNPEEI